jgi:hypothetical protein
MKPKPESVPNGHTPDYNRYLNILLAGFASPELSESDKANIHMMTKFVRDEELGTINDARERAGIPRLPRLAYSGDLRYVEVDSQRHRIVTEAKVANVKSPEPEETVNPYWEELGGNR